MKKILLLFLITGLALPGFAQKLQKSLGFVLAPHLNTDGLFTTRNLWEAGYSAGSGLFYQQDLSRRFGFTTSLLLRYESREGRCFSCFGPSPLPGKPPKTNLYFLEMPLGFTLNLNTNDKAVVRSYFSFGYSFSRLFYIYETATGEGSFVAREGNSFPFFLQPDVNALNTGFEFRFALKDNYVVVLNPAARLPAFDFTGTGYLMLNLKIGRNL